GHAGNIIPGTLELHLNFRFSTEQTEQTLKDQVHTAFQKYNLNPTIKWRLNGSPFLTDKGTLIDASRDAIFKCTGLQTELSTSGGTSDGRFIAPYGVEVLELGPVNATIHQVDECLSLKDLETLEQIYYSIAETLLV
ncbi:MAG: M20/M25/M40 family metallo-hydrolase, partial [Legionellales bacterium]